MATGTFVSGGDVQESVWIHGVLPHSGPVSIRVSMRTLKQFHDLRRKLGLTGDQVLELAEGLHIEAFSSETALSGAFQALEMGYRPNGRPPGYGKP
jgi:hypothetical protein